MKYLNLVENMYVPNEDYGEWGITVVLVPCYAYQSSPARVSENFG